MAVSIVRRNCTVVCGLLLLKTAARITSWTWLRGVTWCHFGAFSHVVVHGSTTPVSKKTSLDTNLSAGIKGGFSFIFIFPLVCVCD